MTRKYHIEERVLLNKKSQARAYIVAVVEDTRETDIAATCNFAQIELKIADCIEEISLEFDLTDPVERENSLYKAKRLVDILTRFRESLELEAKEIESREAVRPLLKAMAAVG